MEKSLRVVSHVGRDLLQSAQLFKSEEAVVWEYVANALQYVDSTKSPSVSVRVSPRKKEIEIADNGRGMDDKGLQHFFTMHGENQERKTGRPGRGKFGTGKSAAFGIARELEVDTVRNNVRNTVALTKTAIEQSSGTDVALNWQRRNIAHEGDNGTTVRIREVFLDTIDAKRIIEYIERNLPHFRAMTPTVMVNDHICEVRQPTIASTQIFEAPKDIALVTGNITLTIHTALAPLPDFQQGISVTAGDGNLVAIEKCAVDRKEFGSYLFGSVDVPRLEEESEVAAYDSTRSLSLNPQHPLVRVLVPFIGARLEQVRLTLVAKEREGRKDEEARRLRSESEKIASILNQDFGNLKRRIQQARAATASRGSQNGNFGEGTDGGAEEDTWVKGFTKPGVLDKPTPKGGESSKESKGRESPNVNQAGQTNEDGADSVSPAGGAGTARKRPAGGFKVEYRHLGSDQHRSMYDAKQLTIIINLDHPSVAALLKRGGVDDPMFKRLSYEIAFTEYAFALGYEFLRQDPEMPGDDVMYEVRETLNRIALAAASLYG